MGKRKPGLVWTVVAVAWAIAGAAAATALPVLLTSGRELPSGWVITSLASGLVMTLAVVRARRGGLGWCLAVLAAAAVPWLGASLWAVVDVYTLPFGPAWDPPLSEALDSHAVVHRLGAGASAALFGGATLALPFLVAGRKPPAPRWAYACLPLVPLVASEVILTLVLGETFWPVGLGFAALAFPPLALAAGRVGIDGGRTATMAVATFTAFGLAVAALFAVAVGDRIRGLGDSTLLGPIIAAMFVVPLLFAVASASLVWPSRGTLRLGSWLAVALLVPILALSLERAAEVALNERIAHAILPETIDAEFQTLRGTFSHPRAQLHDSQPVVFATPAGLWIRGSGQLDWNASESAIVDALGKSVAMVRSWGSQMGEGDHDRPPRGIGVVIDGRLRGERTRTLLRALGRSELFPLSLWISMGPYRMEPGSVPYRDPTEERVAECFLTITSAREVADSPHAVHFEPTTEDAAGRLVAADVVSRPGFDRRDVLDEERLFVFAHDAPSAAAIFVGPCGRSMGLEETHVFVVVDEPVPPEVSTPMPHVDVQPKGDEWMHATSLISAAREDPGGPFPGLTKCYLEARRRTGDAPAGTAEIRIFGGRFRGPGPHSHVLSTTLEDAALGECMERVVDGWRREPGLVDVDVVVTVSPSTRD